MVIFSLLFINIQENKCNHAVNFLDFYLFDVLIFAISMRYVMKQVNIAGYNKTQNDEFSDKRFLDIASI